jgi:hypothetical protein
MCAVERLDLVDHAVEHLLPGVAQFIAEPGLDLIARYGGDELVTAHPDVPVQAPDREHDVVLPESAVPAQRMLVIRIDERPVDVENRGRYDCLRSMPVFTACRSCRPSANSSISF